MKREEWNEDNGGNKNNKEEGDKGVENNDKGGNGT